MSSHSSIYAHPIYGGDSRRLRGYSNEASGFVNSSNDGIDLNTIWDDWSDVLAIWNEERASIASLLSYYTTLRGEAVPQTLGQMKFEEASEFGVPASARSGAEPLALGYTFADYDLRLASTWKYLRDADARQLTENFQEALEADNRLVTGMVLDRLFNPKPDMNDDGRTVYGLYTGNDDFTPPPFRGREFPSTTSHYFTTGSTTLDSADVENAIKAVTSKGYGPDSGAQLIVLCHEFEADVIGTWRRGEPSREPSAAELSQNPDAKGPIAKFDFVLSNSAPAFLSDETIVGRQAPGDYKGLPVLGSYGDAYVIKSTFIPPGYLAVVATGGPGSEANPIAIREHPKPEYRGLRIIGGKGPYPLQDSFLQRSCGTGVRRRGAAAVVQVTSSTTYTAPTFTL